MPKPTMEIVPRDEAAEQRAREKQEAADKERAEQRRQERERTGGPVHPTSTLGCTTSEGLTIRDWFGGQVLANVMPGLVSNQVTVRELAQTSYEIADAMIRARKAAAHD